MRRASPPARGFTLVELLVVLTVVGILLAVGMGSLLGTIRRGEVSEGARALAADLERARSGAQRQSLPASVAWTAVAGQAITGYTLTLGTVSQSRAPLSRVKVTCVSMTGSACNLAAPQLTFAAPYAEASGGAVFQVSHLLSPSTPPVYVKVGGVTGKVSLSETQD